HFGDDRRTHDGKTGLERLIDPEFFRARFAAKGSDAFDQLLAGQRDLARRIALDDLDEQHAVMPLTRKIVPGRMIGRGNNEFRTVAAAFHFHCRANQRALVAAQAHVTAPLLAISSSGHMAGLALLALRAISTLDPVFIDGLMASGAGLTAAKAGRFTRAARG